MLETLYHNFRMCFPVWSLVSSYKVSMHRPSFITNIEMPAVRVNEIQVSVKYEAFIVFFCVCLCSFSTTLLGYVWTPSKEGFLRLAIRELSTIMHNFEHKMICYSSFRTLKFLSFDKHFVVKVARLLCKWNFQWLCGYNDLYNTFMLSSVTNFLTSFRCL